MGEPQLKGRELLREEGGWQELCIRLPAQQRRQLQQAHLCCHVPCLQHDLLAELTEQISERPPHVHTQHVVVLCLGVDLLAGSGNGFPGRPECLLLPGAKRCALHCGCIECSALS